MDTKKSFFFKFYKSVWNSILNLGKELYLFNTIVFFYLSIWVINPGYKFITAAFLFLIFVVNIKIKNLRLSLLVVFIVSNILFVGKTYVTQLIPIGVFDVNLFPDGFLIYQVITPSNVLATLMLIVLIRDLFTAKIKIDFFKSTNLLLIIFYLYNLLSDLFGSKNPSLSISSYLLGLNSLIMYFYIISYVRADEKFIKIIIGTFCAFIFFESIISLQQFVNLSLIGKNIEYLSGITAWGAPADEIGLKFRPLGTYYHAVWFASDLVIWLIFTISMYIKTHNMKLLFISLLGMMILALTLTRSAWIALVIAILIMFFVLEKIKKQKINIVIGLKYKIVFLAFGLLSLFAITPRIVKSLYTASDGGGAFRLEQLAPTIQVILQHPLLGVGKRMLIPTATDALPDTIFGRIPLDVHNWFLLLTAEHGIPSLLILTLFVVISLKELLRRLAHTTITTNVDYLYLATICSIAVFFIVGLFSDNNTIFYIILFLAFLNKNEIYTRQA